MSAAAVLVGGAAPYLGGSETWRPLRETAPEFVYAEIDPLDIADAPDMAAELRERIADAGREATVVVAHDTSAGVALDAIASGALTVPLLLLSPLVATRATVFGHAMAAFAGGSVGRRLFGRIAGAKHAKLLIDDTLLHKQLEMFVAARAITSALFEQAKSRVRDPRTARAVDRTSDVVVALLRPVSLPPAETYRVLVGDRAVDRKTARRMRVDVVPGISGAAMLEAPGVVAEAMRRAVSGV